MPGVLSEGSFHDYIPESWRLRNNDFLHHESWAFLRSFMEFYSIAPVNQGVIAGVVRDTLKTPEWYFKPGTRDEKLPINGARVTLKSENKVYNIDDLNNGFFFFDSIAPGDYKLYFDGLEDYYKDSLTVKVTANKTTLADIYLKPDTTRVPQFVSITPDLSDSIAFNQEFTFSFNLPMNRDSVQKAIQFIPSVSLNYTWDAESKVLKVKPSVGFASKTSYIIRIKTTACSKWKVKIADEEQFDFVTSSRLRLKIERNFPVNGMTGVTLYPQVRVYFDAPINSSSASSEIVLQDNLGQPLSKVREEFIETSGKGAYFFEPAQPLELNKQYKLVVKSGLTDVTGLTPGQNVEINFTTRVDNYVTGTIVESYEDISKFWDPEASGSTTGTDNPLTTFTASAISHSGTYSGKLNYVFTGASGGVCRVFDTRKPYIGQNTTASFGIWVFGDLSNNKLEYWFYSSGTTNQEVYVDTIDWAGWDLRTIPLSKIGGSGDRQFHSTVIKQTSIGSKSGTILFDDALLYIPTGIEEQETENIDFDVYPNPLCGEGIIKYTLKEKSMVSLGLYSLDGRKIMDLINELQEPGVKTIHWNPSPVMSGGIYLVRLETRSAAGSSIATGTRRWVLAR